jgi:hypothetical protein
MGAKSTRGRSPVKNDRTPACNERATTRMVAPAANAATAQLMHRPRV